MGDGQTYCYSAREIRQTLRAQPQEPRGLVAGFQAFVDRDRIARARLTSNHPKRHSLLDRVDNLPFTVHEDLMHLDPASVFTPTAREALVHPWHLENPDRAQLAGHAEAALLLVRFLTLLAFAGSRMHPFAVLLVLSQLLDRKAGWPNSTPPHVPATRSDRAVKPPGQLVLAEPCQARAPASARLSLTFTVGTVLACVRLGGAL